MLLIRAAKLNISTTATKNNFEILKTLKDLVKKLKKEILYSQYFSIVLSS